jgi:hypothetical protein
VNRIALFEQTADDGMARLVVGGVFFLFLRHHDRLALRSDHHAVDRLVAVVHLDDRFIAPRREQRGLVEQILQIGAGESGRAFRKRLEQDFLAQRLVARMHFQDLLPAFDVRAIDHDLAIETAGPQQGRVEHVGAVRRRDQDHAGVLIEAVHLHEQLIERLLALVMAAAQTRAALAADGVDFVDEDDARRRLFRLIEEVANARGAHADEHFDEVRTGNGEKRHAGFARNRAREQRFAGARRAEQQHALGNARAERLELLGVLQELDNLAELLLGLIHARNVVERHLGAVFREHLCAGTSERQRLTTSVLRLPQDYEEEEREYDER